MKANTFLSFVLYKDLNLWDVKRYYSKSSIKFTNAIALSEVLTPYRQQIDKEEMIKNKWHIISKINFGGELFLRDFEEVQTYRGKLFLVPDNSIIYSKINARHGCIYYHAKGETPFGASSEYPTYTFDNKKVNGVFLQKLLRSEFFKELLNKKSTGISKPRVKQDEFLSIQIPLPALDEQESIIKSYHRKKGKAEKFQEEALNIKTEIKKYFLKELGVQKRGNFKRKKGLNIIEYATLSKWSLNHINRNTNGFESGKFKVEKLKNLLTLFEGGKTPSKSRKDFWNGNIFWTSPKDFNGHLLIKKAEDKITDLAIKETGIKVYPKGIILSVFRSGILQHSFPTAITEIETAINQDLKAYSVNEKLLNKKYYLHFAHTFKKYILALASKKSVTVESINTEDFFEISIPLPPIEIQNKIASNIDAIISKIEKLKLDAANLILEAEEEFEQSIFS